MPFPNPVGSSGRFEGPDKSDDHRRRADFIGNIALFALTAPIGGGLVGAAGKRLQPFTSGLSFAKRPIHTTLAWKSQWNQPVGQLLNKTLVYRKKANQLALGYSLVNPMQNVNYIRKEDWKRLLINMHSPIIGVPIYEVISSLVSAQPDDHLPSGPHRNVQGPTVTSDRSPWEGSARSPLSPSAPPGGLGDGRSPSKRGSGIPPGRRRQRHSISKKSRKWCDRHKKYDFCHRRRW